jgi:tetratricopeptide (TPR) repeat protein
VALLTSGQLYAQENIMFSPLMYVVNLNKSKIPFFLLRLTLSFLLMFSAINVLALQSSQSKEELQEKDEIERIIVSGSSLDAAKRAFNAGDFELAEIEFKKNAKCALRMERNKQAFVNGLQNSSINNSLQQTASIQTGSSSQGNSISNSSTVSSSIGGRAVNQPDKTTKRDRTCSSRGYQLYMTGLSQIQLGRTDEAEKNLKTASFLNKNIYDAHYRLALMHLLRKDTQSAKERLSNIQEVLKRCRDCESREEILVRIDFLKKALSGEIRLK